MQINLVSWVGFLVLEDLSADIFRQISFVDHLLVSVHSLLPLLLSKNGCQLLIIVNVYDNRLRLSRPKTFCLGTVFAEAMGFESRLWLLLRLVLFHVPFLSDAAGRELNRKARVR